MSAALILLFVLLGAGAGTVHFVAISRDAELLVRGGSPLAASAMRLGRVVLTIAILTAAAWQGWPMLLGATAGFMMARHVVLRRLGTTA